MPRSSDDPRKEAGAIRFENRSTRLKVLDDATLTRTLDARRNAALTWVLRL
jgi:hypothetical protein